MTKAQILQQIRDLMREKNTDSGAEFSDSGNLIVFIDDAMEQVVMDVAVIQNFPEYLCGTENITLVANQNNYTLTARWIDIYKLERTVSGEPLSEIRIGPPLDNDAIMNSGETDANPRNCFILGETIYFTPTPAAAHTNYAKAYYTKREAATIATNGPQFLPAESHRLIVYWACALCAVRLGAKPKPFYDLYGLKLRSLERLWERKYQQEPRFVGRSVEEKSVRDSRESAFYDLDW